MTSQCGDVLEVRIYCKNVFVGKVKGGAVLIYLVEEKRKNYLRKHILLLWKLKLFSEKGERQG